MLAVGQSVHRIDDNRLDALAAASPQNVVNNRNNIGEAFARSRATGQDIRFFFLGLPDSLGLVSMQNEGFAGVIGFGLFNAEYPRTFVVQCSV